MDRDEDQRWDAVVIGTGIKECLLGALLSTRGRKVAHVDKNLAYGGELPTLNLKELLTQFRPKAVAEEKKAFGEEELRSRLWNIDLCPKVYFSNTMFLKCLVFTGLTSYLKFKPLSASFVYGENGKLYKVPSASKEAVPPYEDVGFIGIFQRRKVKSFLQWAAEYKQDVPETYKGLLPGTHSAKDAFTQFKLEPSSQVYITRALCLQTSDAIFAQPVLQLVQKLQTNFSAGGKLLYPLLGSGAITEAFARGAAIHGGLYCLGKPVDELKMGEDGRVFTLITEGDGKYDTREVIGPSSYFRGTDRVLKKKHVVRWLFLISHPLKGTKEANSGLIVIPAAFSKHKHDVHVFFAGSEHLCAPPGRYFVVISAETDSESPQTELKFAADLIGEFDHQFLFVDDYLVDSDDSRGAREGIRILKSWEAEVEATRDVEDVIKLYHDLTGHKLELKDVSAHPKDLLEQY